MSEPTQETKPEAPAKVALSKEILLGQREAINRQLNEAINKVEQLRGMFNFVNGLLSSYELPSTQEKEPTK